MPRAPRRRLAAADLIIRQRVLARVCAATGRAREELARIVEHPTDSISADVADALRDSERARLRGGR